MGVIMRVGEARDDVEARLERALPACPGLADAQVTYEAATVSVASPVRRATDWAGFRLEGGEAPVWAKVLYDDMRAFVDPAVSVEAARRAGELGIGPAVLGADVAAGVMFLECLDTPWRWAKVDEIAAPDTLEVLLNQKRRMHDGAPLSKERDIFWEIEDLLARCWAEGAPLPADVPWLCDNLAQAAEAIGAAGVDLRPAQGDGAASNVMLGPDGEVRLVDFDSAGNQDPFLDLASTLVEVTQFDNAFEDGIALFAGSAARALVARCRLYAAADDLRWALWGLLAATASPRKGVEFFKYGQWRLLRGRAAINDHRFEMWLRQV